MKIGTIVKLNVSGYHAVGKIVKKLKVEFEPPRKDIIYQVVVTKGYIPKYHNNENGELWVNKYEVKPCI